MRTDDTGLLRIIENEEDFVALPVGTPMTDATGRPGLKVQLTWPGEEPVRTALNLAGIAAHYVLPEKLDYPLVVSPYISETSGKFIYDSIEEYGNHDG